MRKEEKVVVFTTWILNFPRRLSSIMFLVHHTDQPSHSSSLPGGKKNLYFLLLFSFCFRGKFQSFVIQSKYWSTSFYPNKIADIPLTSFYTEFKVV